ncbi:MAG: hypothetical protein ABI769_19290 [Pseudomonadota bacterium]
MKKSLLVSVAATLIFTGCIAWKPVDSKPVTSTGGKYSINLPVGWNVLSLGNTQNVTRYGNGLQQLVVTQVKNKGAFGTGKDKTDASPDMDPRDLCNKVVANLKMTPNHETIEINSVAPMMLGGRAGFRAELTSKRTFQADGIRYKHLLYGVANQNGLYTLHYEAPLLYYYDKNVAEVEKSVATLKLL